MLSRLFLAFLYFWISLSASIEAVNDYDQNWCEMASFELAYLNWRVSGDEFDYAYDIREADDVYRKRFHNVSGEYDPGFRVGLGLNLPCICWDSYLAWTHFDTKNTSRHHVNFRGGLNQSVAIPFFRLTEADLSSGDRVYTYGKVNLNTDWVDLEFGKWLDCTDCLLVRPHVGFRAADICEKFHTELDAFSVQASQTNATYQTRIHNEFKGVGVRAGLDANLHLCDGWSVTGRTAASLVWGYTKVRNIFRVREGGQETTFATSKETDHYRHLRAFTDLSLGIRYSTCYCCYPLHIEAAWEHHYLFGQHRFFASDTIQESLNGYNFKKDGDVALQGLTLSASLDF